MSWKNSAVSFPSQNQKLLSIEMQHKVAYSIAVGMYNMWRQSWEGSWAVPSVALFPFTWEHL